MEAAANDPKMVFTNDDTEKESQFTVNMITVHLPNTLLLLNINHVRNSIMLNMWHSFYVHDHL